jgi:TolB-like protein/Tfp pilus assembly protein PilF
MARSVGWLVEELRRRNVLRAAAFYAAGGWVLVQVATQVFPFFDIPNWTVRLVVVAVIAGLPFALVISWFYELTPQGFKPEAEPEQTAAGSASRRSLLKLALLSAAAVAAAVLIAAALVSHKPESAAAQPSIAVLPFRNLSSNADTGYFAEGIQDEILTRLARIGALKVISRTSTAHYASTPEDLPKIASELSVDNIVEGSVQRHEDEVRINVQLIKAGGDANIWSETYDRKLDDVFGVESEVARAIADSLRAKLTGEEERTLDTAPTQNAEAYDQYLRGLVFDLRSFEPANLSSAAGLLRHAVQLDPQFALAWARLARVDANLAYQGFDAGSDLCDKSHQEAAAALKLQPHLGEAQLAQGYYLYLCRTDLQHAQEAFELARLDLPGSAEVLEAMGRIEHRRGAWNKAVDYMQQATQLDPRNTALLASYALTRAQMRQFGEALKLADRALDVEPDDPAVVALQVFVYQALGQTARAQQLLDAFAPHLHEVDVFDYQVLQLLYRRQYPEAISELQHALAQDLGQVGEGAGDYYYLLGVAQRAAGNAEASHRAFADGRSYLARFRSATRSGDNDIYVNALLCLMDAGLATAPGDSEGCRATQDAAHSDSPFAPSASEALARAAALRGDATGATAVLPQLLRASYYSFLYSAPLTPALLRQDPLWDAVRTAPAFAALAQVDVGVATP